MTLTTIVQLMRQGIWMVFQLTAPVLGTSLVVGLIVAIFQATTSIQEQTLTFLPKLIAILLVLALLGGWMFSSMRSYMVQLFNLIPQVAR